jgi:glutamate N-acetyltransferase/amino-acid N-acetyltransferase
MEKMKAALPDLEKNLGAGNGFGLAQTIMTTDLVPKWTFVQGYIGGKRVTVSGIAKGSGMIAPDMGTMLSFVLTDAAVDKGVLQAVWEDVTADTFNRVTVDSDTSTNDTACIMANGQAGNPVIDSLDTPEGARFRALLFKAVNPLAKKIAEDGEGATKLIKVEASGFGDNEACGQVARTVAESPLVKTAMFGNDPNWGRIIAAAGRSGVEFPLESVFIDVCHTRVFSRGTPAHFNREQLSEKLKAKEVYISLFCKGEGGYAYFYTCDYSYDYIKINAEYHT